VRVNLKKYSGRQSPKESFGLLASNRHNPRRALSQFSAARVTTRAAIQVSTTCDSGWVLERRDPPFQGVNGMKKVKVNMKLMTAALVAVMIAGAGIALTAAIAQGKRKHESKQEEKAKYHSSVQVQDDKSEREESEEAEGAEKNEAVEANEVNESKESEKGEEAEDKAEGAESERLKSLARITPEQASAAALAQVPGTVMKVGLENEDGNVVYGVEIKTADGKSDVKVDAGDGRVLHVEKEGEDN